MIEAISTMIPVVVLALTTIIQAVCNGIVAIRKNQYIPKDDTQKREK